MPHKTHKTWHLTHIGYVYFEGECVNRMQTAQQQQYVMVMDTFPEKAQHTYEYHRWSYPLHLAGIMIILERDLCVFIYR